MIAASALFIAPATIGTDGNLVVLFIVTALALIVAWFALTAGQWWWTIVFVAIAVLWNPAYPLPFTGWIWTAAQLTAAVVFLVAGILIKIERSAKKP